MFKKCSSFAISLCSLFFIYSSANAENNQPEHYRRYPYNHENEYDEENGDVWFGPGYYYGMWFYDEDNYWDWRQDHLDYPSNRYYYDHDHPVEYRRGEGGEGRGMENRGVEERGGRGGGARGGGGRR